MTFRTKLGSRSLRIVFGKVYEFISDYDETKYFVLFGPENYDPIFHRIRYLTGLKSGIADVHSHLIIMQKSKLIQMLVCL